jgi:mono/diheme cytochrome c family protein
MNTAAHDLLKPVARIRSRSIPVPARRGVPDRSSGIGGLFCQILCWYLLSMALLLCSCSHGEVAVSAPQRLADTGLYADFAARQLAPGVLSFTPQYPLWTDGASKRRWIALPAGTAVDAGDPDHWEFPAGTRLWKEFGFGRPVETRFMERQRDGSWLYATYAWNEDGSDAVLAPAAGVRNVCATGPETHHDLPAVSDCRACHEATRTPVLGFSALQLSPDRDPLAPHADTPRPGDVDLDSLVQRGLLRNLPARFQEKPPVIAARTPRERAALGYLHGNCSSCHNAEGPLQRLGLRFDVPLGAKQAPVLATAVSVPSGFTRPGATMRIAEGDPDHSTLVHRLAATDPLAQMPPFGRHLADRQALNLIEAWVRDLASMPVFATNQPVSRRP